MKKHFFLMTLLLAFYGCNGGGGSGSSSGTTPNTEKTTDTLNIPEKEEPKEFKAVAERKVQIKTDLSNLNDFKSNIDFYSVRFKKVSGKLQDHKVVCKSNEEKSKSYESSFGSDASDAVIFLNLDNSKFSPLQLNCRVTGKDFDRKETIIIKKSLIVSFERFFKDIKSEEVESLELDTLLIEKDGVIYSDDQEQKLKVRTLISNNGKIVNFKSGDTAEGNKDGMDGGDINIEALNILGKLQIELRGQNGGAQFNQPAAKDFRPATPNSLNANCQDNEENKNNRCVGKKGVPGVAGDAGYPGFNGGDSGALDLQVTQLKNAKIFVKYFPGKGGRGGDGGNGGPGSFGGRGSTVKYYKEHDSNTQGTAGGHGGLLSFEQYASANENKGTIKYDDGPEGDRGAQGPRGVDGLSGYAERSYVLQIDENIPADFDYDWEN